MKKLITLLLFTVALAAKAQVTNSVTVAWDSNPETNITNYSVYHGLVGSTVTNKINAGTNLQQIVQPLEFGSNYWFYVTAQNNVGLESDPSLVLTYETPTPPQAPTGVSVEFRLLSASTVSGPFTNVVEFKVVEPVKFYLAEVDKVNLETNLSNIRFTYPPKPNEP